MNLLSLGVRVFIALFIGFCITVSIIQRDKRFIYYLEQKLIEKFETIFDAHVTGEIVSVNFIFPSLSIKNIAVSDKGENEWYWHAKSVSCGFSWIQWLLSGKIPLHIKFDELNAFSVVKDDRLIITDHIKQLINQEAEQFVLYRLNLSAAQCTISLQKNIVCTMHFHTEAASIHQSLKVTTYITDGTFFCNNVPLITDVKGALGIEIAQQRAHDLMIRGDGSLRLPHMEEDTQICYINGYFDGRNGRIEAKNKKKAFSSHIIDWALDKKTKGFFVHLDAALPVDYLRKIFHIYSADIPLHGMGAVSLYYDTKTGSISGKLCAHNIGIQHDMIQDAFAFIIRDAHSWIGTAELKTNTYGDFHGSYQWDEKKWEGTVDCVNTSTLHVFGTRHWYIPPNNGLIMCFIDEQGARGSYKFNAKNEKLNRDALLKGSFLASLSSFATQGTFGTYSYEVEGSLIPLGMITKLDIVDIDNKPLMQLQSTKKSHEVQGTIYFSFIRSLFSHYLGYELSGKGDVTFEGKIDNTTGSLSISLRDGKVRLPGTFNFIKQIDAQMQVDFQKNQIIIKNIAIGLHKGELSCKRARFIYSNKGITFFHFPLLIDKMFVNLDHDLWAKFSGRLLFEQRDIIPLLSGHVIIDKAQICKNIFSNSVQKNVMYKLRHALFGSQVQVEFDVDVKTTQPITVSTSVLKADLNTKIMLKGNIKHPQITGEMHILQGTLGFPYKPLRIVRGSLYFLPHQLPDPAIELKAQGRIKKYLITLYVSGSLCHPHIQFVSTPPLTEEQILTLLLAGSEEGSFTAVVPSLIMRNVQSLLFGSDQKPSRVESYLTHILKPFKHIRIVPSFNDQTARGGFRAALEIDVNDQLRASILKNFSLTEDTRIEIEYFLSDDIMVRGLKDERGDLSGELEVKWTF